VRKLKNRFIVWPVYLDASKTESDGRHLPKKIALNSPLVQEIFDAAKALKLNPELRSDAHYPKNWWEKSGYVILDRVGSKNETLRTLAGKIVALRSRRKN